MRFNVFRNLPTDPIISHMRIGWEEGIRKQTEDYWRDKITQEIAQRVNRIAKENGGYCFVIHECEVMEAIELSKSGV